MKSAPESVVQLADRPICSRKAARVVGVLCLVVPGVLFGWLQFVLDTEHEPGYLAQARPLPTVLGVLFGLMTLGATKRAFSGFDRGVVMLPPLFVGWVLLGHLWVLGPPRSYSAVGNMIEYAIRCLGLGAAAAVLSVGVLLATMRSREPLSFRRATATLAWFVTLSATFSMVWIEGALGPLPLASFEHAPLRTTMVGSGALITCGVGLLVSSCDFGRPKDPASP